MSLYEFLIPLYPVSEPVPFTRLRPALAGKISLEWSFNTHDAGWVYYSPERERVFFIGSKNFNDLNLNRFSKRQNK